MELSVVVEQVEGNGYRASCGEPIPMTADGASREEALLRLQERVSAKMAAGLEVVRIRVPTFTPDRPLWPDDEFTRAWLDGIAGECGGGLTCATCHVYVDPEWAGRLPPPDADERDMLQFTAAERRPTSRLCCQLRMSEEFAGLRVEVPEFQY